MMDDEIKLHTQDEFQGALVDLDRLSRNSNLNARQTMRLVLKAFLTTHSVKPSIGNLPPAQRIETMQFFQNMITALKAGK